MSNVDHVAVAAIVDVTIDAFIRDLVAAQYHEDVFILGYKPFPHALTH